MADLKGKVLYSWESKEYDQAKRGMWWYVIVFGLALLAIIYAIYNQSWFLIGVVVMIVFALYVMGNTPPRTFEHVITDEGVRVANRFYGYDQIKSFWINTREGAKPVLSLLTARRFDLLQTLQINRSDVEKVRRILLEYLPEEGDRGEDTIDKIGRFLKF